MAPSDALRARIYNWRAKVRRRQKDFTAASEDVAQALELAHGLNDERVMAETYLDASLVAERRNEYSLAREYAERSKALFERVSDQEYVGKLLNNLGQLHAITGKPEQAVPLLRESFRIAVELDNRVDAAFAASSLASARLHTGDLEGAIESANRAIELLRDRDEFSEEEGNARMVMGRALMALDRYRRGRAARSAAAAKCFEAVETVSHWPAHGWRSVMWPTRRGETGSAADCTGEQRRRCRTFAGSPGRPPGGARLRQVGDMKYLARRPTLFLWVMVLAVFVARVHHHHGGRGFHQW